MYCLLNLLHVSALTAPSSRITLSTSQNRLLCQGVTMVELQSMKYIIYGF